LNENLGSFFRGAGLEGKAKRALFDFHLTMVRLRLCRVKQDLIGISVPKMLASHDFVH
jgi:hypothetical protein